ncbi:hypothetical protein BDW22DRAFT_970052 [Trametopsis cervina]|nr:hypothetical protein BDW22DRAFT_970052 [Trametopsis cervina]
MVDGVADGGDTGHECTVPAPAPRDRPTARVRAEPVRGRERARARCGHRHAAPPVRGCGYGDGDRVGYGARGGRVLYWDDGRGGVHAHWGAAEVVGAELEQRGGCFGLEWDGDRRKREREQGCEVDMGNGDGVCAPESEASHAERGLRSCGHTGEPAGVTSPLASWRCVLRIQEHVGPPSLHTVRVTLARRRCKTETDTNEERTYLTYEWWCTVRVYKERREGERVEGAGWQCGVEYSRRAVQYALFAVWRKPGWHTPRTVLGDAMFIADCACYDDTRTYIWCKLLLCMTTGPQTQAPAHAAARPPSSARPDQASPQTSG